MTERFDVAIVGAGMAGASLAAELAPHVSVLVLEGEDAPGYHSTGRSAAFWAETYGGPGVYPLTAASGGWLRDGGFLTRRGALNIGGTGDRHKVEALVDSFRALGAELVTVGRDELERRVPGLLPEWTCGSWEPSCADIDVAGVHAHYLAAGRRAGTVLRVRAWLDAAEREGADWRLGWRGGEALAGVLVDAAGAWADQVASVAGAWPLGIGPLRRTVAQLRTDPPARDDLPLTIGIDGDFYFKPQAGRLWLSPHDETPDIARDVAPEDIDIARTIDRLGHVVGWKVEALERKWAGLRSFAPDRLPVYGFDPVVDGFFWFAGQGGFGIQTAPAAARLGAQLLLGRDADAMTAPIDSVAYSPARFMGK
ncbi:FAD-binding oxidoreductase [Novosphingobium sp. ZN18A2]|uniref:NAD(P)/FAD-dependent oxidoreductase n=1 Tax=Novosphingobium sp. ZN18A2 TaxID=3079861 RepID=UPI0030D0315D